MQLVLHSEESEEVQEAKEVLSWERGRRREWSSVQKLRVLQAEEVYVDHGDAHLSEFNTAVPEEANSAD